MTEQKAYVNNGILFCNDRKSGERDRDHKGEGNIDCPHCGTRIELWLSGWIKTARNGAKFLTLAFKPKDAPQQAQRYDNDADADIPF